MAKIRFSNFLISCFVPLVIACTDTVEIDSQSILLFSDAAYAISPTKAEFIGEIKNINEALKSLGIVVSESPNPSTKDRVISVPISNNDQILQIIIDGLTPNKTYFVKPYYESINGTLVYGDEQRFSQVISPLFINMDSPSLNTEEIMLPENPTKAESIALKFTKLNVSTQQAINTYFFPFEGLWNPSYYVLNASPFQCIYNSFNAPFTVNDFDFILTGAGHQRLENGEKFFLKDLKILNLDGYKYEPQYPGKNVETDHFGFRNYAYVIERSPKGTIWRFEFEKNKWTAFDTLPFDFSASYDFHVVDNKIHVLVKAEGSKIKLYIYDLDTKKWETQEDDDILNRVSPLSFVYKSKLYFGAGQAFNSQANLKDFYVLENKKWVPAFTYPGGGSINLIATVFEGNVYMGFGQKVISNTVKGERFVSMRDFWKLSL